MHQESPFFLDGSSQRSVGEGSGSLNSVMEELASITARQAELVARAKGVISDEGAHARRKISDLEAQLAALQADLASSKAEQLDSKAKLERAEMSAWRAGDAKLSMMAELEKERAAAEAQRANSQWSVKFIEQYKKENFKSVEDLRSKVQVALNLQEEKLRKLSIEIDEELYPQLCQSVAERR